MLIADFNRPVILLNISNWLDGARYMQLHTTLTSPYGRLARIAVIEHDLTADVEVLPARTREVGSPYYQINPSGRVPFLVLDDGRTFEGSQLICAYFDAIGRGPALMHPESQDDWAYGRLQSQAMSLLDGLAVLGRELKRPKGDRSAIIIAHEQARADRLADVWEGHMENTILTDPILTGPLNMVQMILVCAMDSAESYAGRSIRTNRPALSAWHSDLRGRPSINSTKPDGNG